MNNAPEDYDSIVMRMVSVLDRNSGIDALGELVTALKNEKSSDLLSGAALVLDANVVLRIASHSKSSDIVDYLANFEGPVILPGQVIQEFWNNHPSVLISISKNIEKSLDVFKKEIGKYSIDRNSISEIEQSVERFITENEVTYHPDTIRRTIMFLESMKGKAEVPFAPRSPFVQMAEHRKNAKTPPGFKDTGDGDFFVWLDLLFGLLILQKKNIPFSRVILISNDGKMDWCREGVAHPILAAEAKALLAVPFEIWNLDKLLKAFLEPQPIQL